MLLDQVVKGQAASHLRLAQRERAGRGSRAEEHRDPCRGLERFSLSLCVGCCLSASIKLPFQLGFCMLGDFQFAHLRIIIEKFLCNWNQNFASYCIFEGLVSIFSCSFSFPLDLPCYIVNECWCLCLHHIVFSKV